MINENFMTISLLIIGIGFILLFFGGGGDWALYVGLSDKKKAVASKDWRSVFGKVVSSQIKEVSYQDSDGTRSVLQLDAEYEYTVDGIQYINNKHTPRRIPKGIPYRRAAEVANRSALGAINPVYYYPKNPKESWMEHEAPLSNLTMIIGIVQLSIAACGVGVFGTLVANAIRFIITSQ